MSLPYPPPGYCQTCAARLETRPQGEAYPTLCPACEVKLAESSSFESRYAKRLKEAEASVRPESSIAEALDRLTAAIDRNTEAINRTHMSDWMDF